MSRNFIACQVHGACCRRGPRIDELHSYWINAQVESFERSGAEKHEIAWLAEYNFVIGCCASGIDECRTRPAREDGPIRLAKTHLLQPGNSECLKNCRRKPGERSACVY
jgi:hypothetical protein